MSKKYTFYVKYNQDNIIPTNSFAIIRDWCDNTVGASYDQWAMLPVYAGPVLPVYITNKEDVVMFKLLFSEYLA